ncbi:MAG TPA: flagellar export chaperone FlgN [Acidimicrobiales bacterium]|nr:flagellar export chaperone FlgN [Acidimicrobiales bacterium]
MQSSELRLTALSDLLWRERRLLDLLRFKLEEERLLLEAGNTEWLARASHEIELVLDELGRAELDRAVAVADLGAELRLGPQPTLAVLAAAVPPPWTGLLRAHRQALRLAGRQVERASDANRALLRQGVAAARRELDSLVGGGAR